MITLGIDAHKRSHTVVAVDELGSAARHHDAGHNTQRTSRTG